MKFNFGSTQNGSASLSGGALNLTKGTTLDLAKKAPSLKRCLLGAGWDVARGNESYDLDIAAFLLGENGKVNNIATDVVFFNALKQQGIELKGDNRTGAGDGDDEQIEINLNQLSNSVNRIVFVVTIFEAQAKRQTFGMIDNAYVRLCDLENNSKEICRYELKDNYSADTGVIFAELFKTNDGWSFKAIGEGIIGDLNTILSRYQ